MRAKDSANWTRIGQIVGKFGLQGHVKVLPLTAFVARFTEGARLRLGDEWVEVESVGEGKGHLRLKLVGVDDATSAEALQWQFLEGLADERPPLEDDEFLTSDLIGLRAETSSGELLGQVDDVKSMPAHDVLVVGEILVPAVKQFVKAVNLEEGKIVLELIPGMKPGEE